MVTSNQKGTKKMMNIADLPRIHEQALDLATAAQRAFIAKHGEPMYCGFAWVNVPVDKGNTKSGKAQKLALEALGFSKAYNGGMEFWSPGEMRSQSMDVREAGADAYAAVLESHGITCYARSRAD